MYFFRTQMVNLYTRETAVYELSIVLLLFAVFFFIFDAIQGTAVGTLRGYKDTRIPYSLPCLVTGWLACPSVPAWAWVGSARPWGCMAFGWGSLRVWVVPPCYSVSGSPDSARMWHWCRNLQALESIELGARLLARRHSRHPSHYSHQRGVARVTAYGAPRRHSRACSGIQRNKGNTARSSGFDKNDGVRWVNIVTKILRQPSPG